MIEAKTKMVEPRSGDSSEIFAVGQNIIPIRRVTPELIANLEDTSELEIIPEDRVKTLIIQNKTTNPMYLFFGRVSKYLDSMESFLEELKDSYQKYIHQKKQLFISESEDQAQRTQKSKRTARKLSYERKKSKESKIDLDDRGVNLLTSVLGATIGKTITGGGGSPADVPYKAEKGQLVAKGKTTVGQISGYPVTSEFGWRWGRVHGGVDVGVPEGTMFAIKAQSKVVFAGWQNPKNPNAGYGLLVDVWVDQIGQMLRFAHLSSIAVKVGDTLPAGTILGRSGSTGRSTGPHFHIEAHDTITAVSGKKDPTPYLGYVILGDEVQQRSEGAIERVGKIMVGEAGAEFVVPVSQMPIFTHLMLEEKIKSLNPSYVPKRIFGEFGVKESFGKAMSRYASGGITGGSPEFWQLVAISAREDTRHPQGQADVAQSIYNRVAIGSYPGGKNVTGIITAKGQYQPTFTNPGAWAAITDRESAIAAAAKGPSIIDKAARSLTNPTLQREAAKFVGGRTDFMGESQKPYMKAGDITRGPNHNFFGWFYDARLPGPAPIHPSVKSMTKAVSKPKVSTPTPTKKGLNLIDKFMLWINPSKKERASVNNIDQSIQMEIARETQEQFTFENYSNEIITFYKPTVYYPEEV